MSFPRMTWIGLLIVTLGWGFLLSYPLVASFMSGIHHGNIGQDPARFVPLIGENAIITGFAIAILGAFETALKHLSKIATISAQPRVSSSIRPSRAIAPPPNHGVGGGATVAPAAVAPVAAQAEPMLMAQNGPNEIVTRGALNGRDYVLFRDGSVVVETLLGPRRFGSITEAQEFIGVA